jgi:hypothetical protein
VIAAAIVLLATGQAWRLAPLTGWPPARRGSGWHPARRPSARQDGLVLVPVAVSWLRAQPSSVIDTADTALAAAKPAAASDSQPR